MKVIDSDFYKEALRFISYASAFGWHERNAGNISLRLNEKQIESICDEFVDSNPIITLPTAIPEMAGEYIFTTVSGSYFIDIQNSPEMKFCICKVLSDGGSYRVVWGGLKPTSELCGHLLSLAELKKRGGGSAVYHCHPANIVALSYILPLDDKTVSQNLWASETECPFVFPSGVGVVGFKVPGSFELATATAEKVKSFDAVLWAHHGIFATGDSIASAFGLAHAIEKAAEISLKVISSGRTVLNTITEDQQRLTAETYGFKLNEF